MTITDSRPRHLYRLPDEREITIIFDHGEAVPLTSTFTLEGGEVVQMTLVATADNLTEAQIREYRASVLGSAALDAELALGLHITESSDEAYYSSRMDQRDARHRVAEGGAVMADRYVDMTSFASALASLHAGGWLSAEDYHEHTSDLGPYSVRIECNMSGLPIWRGNFIWQGGLVADALNHAGVAADQVTLDRWDACMTYPRPSGVGNPRLGHLE